jgi:hypothetical protein
MKLADIVAVLLTLLTGIAGILYSMDAKGGSYIEINSPSGEYSYSLNKDRIIHLTGLLGNMAIEIKNNQVRILETNCPEKLCRLRGWVKLTGDSIVCVPNKVIVKIKDKKQDIDAITE